MERQSETQSGGTHRNVLTPSEPSSGGLEDGETEVDHDEVRGTRRNLCGPYDGRLGNVHDKGNSPSEKGSIDESSRRQRKQERV